MYILYLVGPSQITQSHIHIHRVLGGSFMSYLVNPLLDLETRSGPLTEGSVHQKFKTWKVQSVKIHFDPHSCACGAWLETSFWPVPDLVRWKNNSGGKISAANISGYASGSLICTHSCARTHTQRNTIDPTKEALRRLEFLGCLGGQSETPVSPVLWGKIVVIVSLDPVAS